MTRGSELRVATAALVLLVGAPPPASASLTESRRLAAVYDSILAARFDDAETQLKAACPPAPEEACGTLGVVSLWWQILLDPANRRLDEALNGRSAAAIAASDAWSRREPRRSRERSVCGTGEGKHERRCCDN